jgi:hypothetical protein
MWFRDIPAAREAGSVRCASTNVWGEPQLGLLLSAFGLAPEPSFLHEVTGDRAAQVLAAVLHRDMAYKCEVMPAARAKELAYQFLASQETGAKFYINADWSEYFAPKQGPSSFGWNPLTESTFDAVVLVVGQRYATCIWVEDED